MNFYQIKSPLTQITEEKTAGYIGALSEAFGEEFKRVSLEEYLHDDFSLLYVASGGSEGYFIEVFEQLKDKPCIILTSGDSNSLAASMEILSFLKQHGAEGEILHGSVSDIAERIRSLRNAYRAKAALKGKKIGLIGTPSDWLIASTYSPDAMMEKLGLGFVQIDIAELLAEYEKKTYPENKYTEAFIAKGFDRAETEKALRIYGAFRRIVDRYGLCGLTVRCFDLLDTVHTTGCLGLSILNDEGVYGGCEGDVPALLSMVVLGAVTGEPMFLCNPSRFDTEAGTAVFAHCTVPTSMLRDYTLNTHFESNSGVAVQGTFEHGAMTIFKCAGDLSRFHAQEGEVLDMPYSDILCRTQLKLRLDDFSYFLTDPINNHHIICRGRHAKDVEDFFRILH